MISTGTVDDGVSTPLQAETKMHSTVRINAIKNIIWSRLAIKVVTLLSAIVDMFGDKLDPVNCGCLGPGPKLPLAIQSG